MKNMPIDDFGKKYGPTFTTAQISFLTIATTFY